jgi:hypothetical protein
MAVYMDGGVGVGGIFTGTDAKPHSDMIPSHLMITSHFGVIFTGTDDTPRSDTIPTYLMITSRFGVIFTGTDASWCMLRHHPESESHQIHFSSSKTSRSWQNIVS